MNEPFNSSSSSNNSSTKGISQTKTSNNKNADKKRKSNAQDGGIASTKKTPTYRGVTKHKMTGKFEAHLWDKDTWNSQQTKKGRQIYLGAYENEESAARAYDLAALKYWGHATTLNFSVGFYEKEISEMQNSTKEEYVATLKRNSDGFSRGVSKYRGVARHHSKGRWEARIAGVEGIRYSYLGTYASQEKAAIAYDKAAIKRNGRSAVTNFDISKYEHLFEQDQLDEHDTHQQINDEKQEDKQQYYNLDEQEKQDEEINVFPPTLKCLKDMDLHQNGMTEFENMKECQVEQSVGSYLNEDEMFKLDLFEDGSHKKPGESTSFSNNDLHGKPGESTHLLNDLDNSIKRFYDIEVDDSWLLDINHHFINMVPNERVYGNYELNQYGTLNDDFMPTEIMNLTCNIYQDISPDKEYYISVEASDLDGEKEEEKKNPFPMLDDKVVRR